MNLRSTLSALPLLGLACAFACQSGRGPEKEPAETGEPAAAKATDLVHAGGKGLPVEEVPEDRDLPPPTPLGAADGQFTAAPWLDGANRVAAVRLEDRPLVVAAGTGWLKLFSVEGELVGEARQEGGVHTLEVLDVDGDGQDEILVGRGIARGALGAPATLLVYRPADLSAPESIPLAETTRAQVVAAVPASDRPGDLFVASFVEKYMVELRRVSRGADGRWEAVSLGMARVVGGIAAIDRGRAAQDGVRELVVARMYGDQLKLDGDVFIARPDGSRELLPTLRGARAVVAVPGSEAGEVVYTDGWHREYGRLARALITRARFEDGAWKREILVRVADRHGYDRLRVADLHGDGRLHVIAAGNGPALALPLPGQGQGGAPGPAVALGSGDATDAYPADLHGDGALAVIVAGTVPGIWRRR